MEFKLKIYIFLILELIAGILHLTAKYIRVKDYKYSTSFWVVVKVEISVYNKHNSIFH